MKPKLTDVIDHGRCTIFPFNWLLSEEDKALEREAKMRHPSKRAYCSFEDA